MKKLLLITAILTAIVCTAVFVGCDIQKSPASSTSTATDDSLTETPAADAPRRDTPGSMAFVPPVMGMIMASVIVRQLLEQR